MSDTLSSPNRLFDRKSLLQLLIPLIIEQTLQITIGAADTLMIARVGEAALSGISLVDQINTLLIRIFSAMATGGVIITSQYLGRKDTQNARSAARQLTLLSLGIALVLGAFSCLCNRWLLRGLFGAVEDDVLQASVTYFYLSAVSYPFLAIYNVGGALFRGMGNSKVSMYVSALSNILNVIGNALFIFVFHWGVFGAGFSTLLSRIVAAGVMYVLLLNRNCPVNLRGLLHTRFTKDNLSRLLRMSVPNGIENGMFQIGKVLVISVIATLGTASIAAHNVSNTIGNFVELPASAISLGTMTVIGQCVGAKDYEGARYYGKKMMKLAYLGIWCTCILSFVFSGWLVSLFDMSAQVNTLSLFILRFYIVCTMVFWPFSFTLPNVLRGAGDTRYTMVVSMLSMWLCRIVLSYLFVFVFHWGLVGVWIAMILDWVCRGIFFIGRFHGSKWLQIKVID